MRRASRAPPPPPAAGPSARARHAERLRAVRRLAHGDQAERALLAHDVAGVGDPRRRSQALVFHLDAERRHRTLAGVARFPGRRSSTVTGALRSVAGSKMVHCWCEPGPAGRRRAAAKDSATGRALRRARAFRCACPADVIAITRRERPRCARRRGPDAIAPVPGSSENSNDRSAKFDRRGPRVQRRGRRRAEQRHLQAAVFLQLEAVVGADRLADGEADLVAAVVDASPLRGRTVARQIGREVRRRTPEVRAVRRAPPSRRPRRRRSSDGDGPRERTRQWLKKCHGNGGKSRWYRSHAGHGQCKVGSLDPPVRRSIARPTPRNRSV